MALPAIGKYRDGKHQVELDMERGEAGLRAALYADDADAQTRATLLDLLSPNHMLRNTRHVCYAFRNGWGASIIQGEAFTMWYPGAYELGILRHGSLFGDPHKPLTEAEAAGAIAAIRTWPDVDRTTPRGMAMLEHFMDPDPQHRQYSHRLGHRPRRRRHTA